MRVLHNSLKHVNILFVILFVVFFYTLHHWEPDSGFNLDRRAFFSKRSFQLTRLKEAAFIRDVGLANRLIALFRPPRLCFLLARLGWTILALAAPVSVALCYGLFAAGFVMWSYATLPLTIAMVAWTWRAGFRVQSHIVWVLGIWLLLLALVGGVVLAGDRIHWNAFWEGALQVLYAGAFLAVILWAFRHLAKADSKLRRAGR